MEGWLLNSIFKDMKLLRYVINRNVIPSPLAPCRLSYTDLTLVIDGELRYRFGEKDVTVRHGDAIVFPTGSIRERLESDKPATYASFNVTMPENLPIGCEGKIKSALSRDTFLLLEKAEADFNRVSEHSSDKCKALFLYLLMSIAEMAKDSENFHVDRIKQLVHDKISEPLSLSSISKEVHLVPRYICTLFKKHTGLTVTEYICRERVSLAKRLIITHDIPLSEIYTMCGFTDYNYFSRVFKRIVGTTASSYKRSHQLG